MAQIIAPNGKAFAFAIPRSFPLYVTTVSTVSFFKIL